MKIVAIMPVRNEDWILGLSLRALLLWVDALVILDHASIDSSVRIMADVAGEVGHDRIVWFHENDVRWDEMDHRQRLLEVARDWHATHIVTVDADEVLSGNLLANIRTWIEKAPPSMTLQVPWISCRGALDRYHPAGIWAEQDVSIAFRDESRCHWAARNGYHFHHREPMGRPLVGHRPIRGVANGGLMHLQFVSERRLRAKQALYKMQEVIRWPGRISVAELNRMYGLAVYGSYDPARPQLQTAQMPEEWWLPYRHLLQYTDVDADPWQEAECRRLWVEHGAAKFAGLDLFGVCSTK